MGRARGVWSDPFYGKNGKFQLTNLPTREPWIGHLSLNLWERTLKRSRIHRSGEDVRSKSPDNVERTLPHYKWGKSLLNNGRHLRTGVNLRTPVARYTLIKRCWLRSLSRRVSTLNNWVSSSLLAGRIECVPKGSCFVNFLELSM